MNHGTYCRGPMACAVSHSGMRNSSVQFCQNLLLKQEHHAGSKGGLRAEPLQPVAILTPSEDHQHNVRSGGAI